MVKKRMLLGDWRRGLAQLAAKMYGGKRDMFKTLGYPKEISVSDYRARFERNEIANRIVKARPSATWRGGCDVVEDHTPDTETDFEKAITDFDHRVKMWDVFKTADILSGIGRYAVIVIGAPGRLEEPLERCALDDIKYLRAYAEDDAPIERFVSDEQNERYGQPEFYTLNRAVSPSNANQRQAGKKIHWTRCIHVADGAIEDGIYGEPRLRCVWNRLLDIEKVAGGGSEAFWRRADRGLQFDLDPEVDIDEPEKAKLREQLDDYEHGLRRYLTTRGLKVNELGSDVADFSTPVTSLLSLIAAGANIPQRILMGSEQGKLAAKQDRVSWDNQITDRQNDYAGPRIVQPFIDRLISLQAVPVPADGYDVVWSSISTMDDEQRANTASSWAEVNSKAGEQVITPDEIRDVLGLPPLAEVDVPTPAVKAAKKGGASWQALHRAADRFRTARPTYHQRLLRRRQKEAQQNNAGRGAQGE